MLGQPSALDGCPVPARPGRPPAGRAGVVRTALTRVFEVLCLVLVLTALSAGSVAPAPTVVHVHPPASAQGQLGGASGSSPPPIQGHGHPELSPHSIGEVLPLQTRLRSTRRRLREHLASVHHGLLTLLRALRPRSSLPVVPLLAARPDRTLLCVYRI